MKQFDFMKDPDNNGTDSITVDHAPKRKLDLFPRILCVIIALGIWLYMVNVNDADMTETVTLRVELTGVETLESAGMMVYGLGERTVTVTVKGTNRDLKQYSESDYKATIEVGGITEAKPTNLPLNIKLPENSSIIVEKFPGNVLVYADYKEVHTIPAVKVSFGGDGGDRFEGTPSINTLEISGPRSIVKNIAVAEFRIDGELHEGVTDNFSSVKYYDKFGEEIDTMNAVTVLTKSISVTITEKTPAEEISSESGDVTE